jgi:hypothetical protein
MSTSESDGSDRLDQPRIAHTPILSEHPWTGKLPTARAHVATVVVTASGEHEVFWPHERRRVMLHRRPATVYEVDLGLHHLKFPADLPAGDHAGSFQANFSIQWRVLDPSAVINNQITDVLEAIYPQVLRAARRTARTFDISDSADAEDAINKQFDRPAVDIGNPDQMRDYVRGAQKWYFPGADCGLWIRAIVHLTLDEAAIKHKKRMIELARALAEENAEQELRERKEKNQRAIMNARIEMYRDIIAAGNVEQLALQLAQTPGDISAIVAILREEELASRHDTIDFITHMVDSGVIERWEVSDQVREALTWLKEATARVIRERDAQQSDSGPAGQQVRRGRDDPMVEVTDSPPAGTIAMTPDSPAIAPASQGSDGADSR